jgi:hypothetical protein
MFLRPLFEVQVLVNFVVLDLVSSFHIDVKWPTLINTDFTSSNILFKIFLKEFFGPQKTWFCFFFIFYCDQQTRNCHTNHHTPTCFDTIVPSSGGL